MTTWGSNGHVTDDVMSRVNVVLLRAQYLKTAVTLGSNGPPTRSGIIAKSNGHVTDAVA